MVSLVLHPGCNHLLSHKPLWCPCDCLASSSHLTLLGISMSWGEDQYGVRWRGWAITRASTKLQRLMIAPSMENKETINCKYNCLNSIMGVSTSPSLVTFCTRLGKNFAHHKRIGIQMTKLKWRTLDISPVAWIVEMWSIRSSGLYKGTVKCHEVVLISIQCLPKYIVWTNRWA